MTTGEMSHLKQVIGLIAQTKVLIRMDETTEIASTKHIYLNSSG